MPETTTQARSLSTEVWAPSNEVRDAVRTSIQRYREACRQSPDSATPAFCRVFQRFAQACVGEGNTQAGLIATAPVRPGVRG